MELPDDSTDKQPLGPFEYGQKRFRMVGESIKAWYVSQTFWRKCENDRESWISPFLDVI